MEAGGLSITEAPPSPAPGPVRDALAAAAAERVLRAETAMMDAVDAYTARVRGVVQARLRGPKARKGTRYWTEATKSHPVELETKALDPEKIVPDNLVAESVEAVRPVALRVARDAAHDVAGRLGPDSDDAGMFAIDESLLADLVDEALEDMLGVADRYANALREAIVTGDSEGVGLDELIERVDEATTRGGNWLRLNARGIGTALAGKAALEQARALGVTHTQWISRRDGKVRATHVRADGQVRPIGEHFRVGSHHLEYPGDPTGLPDTGEEVYGCRCGLVFADPDDDYFAALSEIAEAARMGADYGAGRDAIRAALASEVITSTLPDVDDLPALASAVNLPTDTVGWRVLDRALDVAPGQRIELPAGTVLGLAPPGELSTATLAVLVPAGTAVGITGGAMVITETAGVAVLAAGAAGVQGRLGA